MANLEDGDARTGAPESGDLLATFRDALGSHPAGAWLYVYQISPRPRHAPGKPAYVKRYDAAEILPDLEDRLAEECGGGLYRLVMKNRTTGGMMGAGEIQISEVYPNRHATEPRDDDPPARGARSEVAALAEELRAMRREIAALQSRPAAETDRPTWREFLEVIKESRGPSSPVELLGMLKDARAEGYREGQGRPPGDEEDAMPRWLQSVLEYGPAIVARMMPAGPMVRRGPASVATQGRASREARIAAPAPPPTNRGEPEADELARVEPVQDSAARGAAPPTLTLAPSGDDEDPSLEEIVRQIDDAILSDPESAEFWADYVFRFAGDDVLEEITPANIELLRANVRGRADFPGFNHETAAGWLRAFLDRFELVRMKSAAGA